MKNIEKVINDCEIKEIVLNPAHMSNDNLKSLENQGFQVRWMKEDEENDEVLFTIIFDENE